MRLGTCVAVEAVVGIALLGGAGVGVYYGYGAARDYAASLGTRPAVAATWREPRTEPLITPIEARLELANAAPPVATSTSTSGSEPRRPAPEASAVATVFPAPDAELLAPLRDSPVVGTKINRGGTTLSIRLDFASGGRAAFKPEQTFTWSNPRKEIAAYRIDRYLHIGRVAPAFGRTFTLAELEAGFAPEVRRYSMNVLRTEGTPRDGSITGVVMWWIPDIAVARVHGFKVDETDGVVTWKRLVRAGATIPDDDRWIAEQISTVTLFDYIIDNIDRWSGGNVRIAPGGKQIFFMDNTASFTPDEYGHRKGQNYLKRVEVFSRDLVARLRAMTYDDLREVMTPEPECPFERILTEREIRAVLGRRDWALAYIDRLIARHGEDAVLVFP